MRKANLVGKTLTRTETKAYNQIFNRLMANYSLNWNFHEVLKFKYIVVTEKNPSHNNE